MKSKILFLSAIILGAFFMKASAQSITNIYSIQPTYYGPTNQSYMMGTVSLPNVGYVPPQNTVPPVNVVQPTQPAQACVPFITTFNKYGNHNADVAKLQQFLNRYNGANLNGLGFYGPATQQEVKNLQYAFGINPTGAQYEKTTDLINKINCGLVQPRQRVVYHGGSVGYVYNPKTSPSGNVPSNVYPNPGQNTQLPGKTQSGTKTVIINNGTRTNINASGSSITETLSSDFDSIKENYKAYVLVLVLIAALFWFLRKAATE